MALVDNVWYVDGGNGSSTGYYSVTQWAALTTKNAGNLVRQLAAPAVGSERVFVCVVGAIATLAAEPTWTLTRGALTAEAASVTWQECTGIAAINGDFSTNTPTWNTVKNTVVTLGQVITNVAGTIVLISTVGGTAGNGAEPTWNAYTNAGATTADNTVTWTNIGVVGNFTGWQAPHARLANSFVSTWGQAGNAFFVASEHAETQSSAMTLTSPGTLANPCFIYCTAKTPVPPTATMTGATISTTGASSIAIAVSRESWDGISILSGNSSNLASINFTAGAAFWHNFKNCSLTLNNTGASVINISNGGSDAPTIELENCTLTFGSNVNQKIFTNGNAAPGRFRMRGGSVVVGASVPTTFMPSCFSDTVLEGVDLSGFGSGKTLIGSNNDNVSVVLKDCKLGASVTVAATPASANQSVDLIRSDSTNVGYREERYRYTGTQTVETTIVRTGGATDGTTIESRKVVTTANSKWILPFECIPITFWNDSTSAITTLTIYGTTTGGGVPKDDEIWIDVEYLSSASTPQGTFITTTKASNLAASAATNNSSDASTWGGGGAGNGFKIVCPSFTPGMKGPITIYVKVAKLSSTYYIDPKPSISGVTISKSEILAPGVYMNELQAGSGLLVHPGMVGGAHG